MDFNEQYKHPLWQKKRLEVLEAAEYACQRCYDGESQLHVHHKHYFKGRKIWEYEASELSALCSVCHLEVHRFKDAFGELLSKLHPDALPELVAVISGYCNVVYGPAQLGDNGYILERIKEDPYSVAIGELAASVANRMTSLDSIIKIRSCLVSSDINSVVNVAFPARQWSGHQECAK